MIRHWFSSTGVLGLAAAALLLAAGPGWAQHHGGGGHVGGGHVGGAHYGGGHYGGGQYYGGYHGGYHGGYYPYHHGFYGYRSYYPYRSWYGLGYYPWLYGGYYPYNYNYYSGTGSYDYYPDTYTYTAPESAYQSFYSPAAGAESQAEPIDPTSMLLTVRVPANAEVWINGARMTQMGTEREFVSPPLTEGRDYSYDVRARWTEDGREVNRTRKISFHAGERRVIDFEGPPPKE
jgi:uncharacterized protein (TIGR03000 family)